MNIVAYARIEYIVMLILSIMWYANDITMISPYTLVTISYILV